MRLGIVCAATSLLLAATSTTASRGDDATSAPFGKTKEGAPVEIYTLKAGAYTAKMMTLGATLVEFHGPDRNGKTADVVLGFDSIDGYLAGCPYFGATVGRVANRVAGGKFTLDGKEYTLAVNNGPNSLHGGVKGFDKLLWKAAPAPNLPGGVVGVAFHLLSKDGDEGYPGNLDVNVTYTLTAKGDLSVVYRATADKATPVNLTHHSYFNLAGPASGSILDHILTINADHYTPTDGTLIPTGELAKVDDTPFDFRTATPIGKRFDQMKGEPIGYDLNYVLRDHASTPASLVAKVKDPKSGRVLEVFTTEPGLQFYTGNFLDGSLKGKGGVVYKQHGAFCLEAQHFPDSVNHPQFPSTILAPGKTYVQTTIYKLTAE